MREFDYLEPRSVEEASRLLAELGEDARVIAGGTALMLAMRQRMLAPTHLVSVARIEALRGIRFDPQLGLRIGALERHSDVARSPLVQQHAPVLASMAARVANPQVRNQGTLGGNLCYADPSTDPPGCLMALDAQLVLGSARGERVLSIEEFLVDYYVTALAPDEIVLEVRVPPLAAGTEGVYTRFLRTAAEHRPLASVAFVARREGALCRQARIAIGASVPIPARMRRAEAFLEGRTVTPAVAAEVADIVAQDIEPVSDLRGNADYRREMVRAATRRTVAELFGLSIDEGMSKT
ncbi:xanthine dehydrogenase family protein subunit M [Xenophilus arseniciresistens]|uniref:Xanthine dehydrogenase family protein subunit M n=1 Tax=Xenophilus arseniciresistens TaxID=1283306 RepID=A0AAE3N489_9BURK|nr:xanthine dehydrogenase family protein subunit M [Xenophilus arseniciresistens]MDA7414961.1 xanthine dehydrogenase family protein subunit M [Xenophilus arseniciresistens]